MVMRLKFDDIRTAENNQDIKEIVDEGITEFLKEVPSLDFDGLSNQQIADRLDDIIEMMEKLKSFLILADKHTYEVEL